MGGSEAWAALAKLIGACLSIIVIAVGGVLAGRKSNMPGRDVEGEVVAATFTERAVLERLIAALHANTSEIAKINERYAEEEHQRELAKAVSDEFEKWKGRS